MTTATMVALLVGEGGHVEAGVFWADVPTPEADRAISWGAPARTALTLGAVAAAARRERALRRVRRSPGLVAVHRLSPPALRGGRIRRAVRDLLLGGALVEIRGVDAPPRPLEAILTAAGAAADPLAIRPGSGDVVLLRGRRDGIPVVLRIAPLGALGGPSHCAAALRLLDAVPRVPNPRLLAVGATTSYSWSVESALPGQRPSKLSAALLSDLASRWTDMPRAAGPPAALGADLLVVEAARPDRRHELDALRRRLEPVLASWPAVLRHGDLWAGNLLAKGGKLTGVVDWDAWATAGVPGTDLLQLVATERRMATKRSLGAAWREAPWCDATFRRLVAPTLDAVGMPADRETLEVVGIAWWAAEVSGTLRRAGHRRPTEQWIAANVDAVLARATSVSRR